MSQTTFGSRLYLDANVYIYALEDHSQFGEAARQVLEAIDRDGITVVAQHLILAELLPHPVKQGATDLVQLYEDLFLHHPQLVLLNTEPTTINLTTKLRATYGFSTLDALHLASAIATECDAFITNDQELKSVQEIPVLLLQEIGT